MSAAAVGMSQEYCKGLSGSLFSLLCFVDFTTHICKNITKMRVIPRVGIARLRFRYEFGTSSVGVQYEFGMSSVQVRYKFSIRVLTILRQEI